MGKWVPVAKVNDLKPNQCVHVPIENKELVLFNVDGKFYALDDACTHAGASLAEGSCEAGVVTCPRHGATFDIKTGEALSDPAPEGVVTYPVKVDGENVLIEI